MAVSSISEGGQTATGFLFATPTTIPATPTAGPSSTPEVLSVSHEQQLQLEILMYCNKDKPKTTSAASSNMLRYIRLCSRFLVPYTTSVVPQARPSSGPDQSKTKRSWAQSTRYTKRFIPLHTIRVNWPIICLDASLRLGVLKDNPQTLRQKGEVFTGIVRQSSLTLPCSRFRGATTFGISLHGREAGNQIMRLFLQQVKKNAAVDFLLGQHLTP